jgi:hypothetical protein
MEVFAAAARIGGFDATFDHCGYTVDGLSTLIFSIHLV